MTRAEKVAAAQRMRAQGMLVREIAAALGVGYSTAAEYLSDPDLTKARERRKRYCGFCADCGGPTDGTNGRARAPKRCRPCRIAYQRTEEARLAQTHWTRERIVEAIQWWADTYGEPPATPDWNPYQTRDVYRDPVRADRAERLIAERQIPGFTTAVDRFGSWNAAIQAAGFTPRAAHGGDGNENRRRRARARAAA